MTQQKLFDVGPKKIGLLPVAQETALLINSENYKSFIKIVYLPAGYTVKVDFKTYHTQTPSLFCVSPNQYLQVEQFGTETGHFIFYNRDFYCIQIHDEEVACDGLLFNNSNNMPMTAVAAAEASFINYLFEQIEAEFALTESSQEEMLRTYLKQLLIKSTRLWKKQHFDTGMMQQNNDLEFFRRFTLLVEKHYKEKHGVADYADLLLMAPKTLTHKFKRLHLPQPNEVIKNRLMLEAKRLLVHTSMSAKEIAYELGYEDPAYFSRQFQVKTGEPPSSFRSRYLSAPS
ncbi:AraC-type DNA-binding protein [Cnuella takakiae]|uniref:AraC-type DNA-binding protein n=1 Tax=Cnuella takakiae TaxID=1302690 RepID=A0A1M4Z0B3_9BACT|nr:helix-turn-helix domain-containing protein [Cnuella takakiae]OLY94368.1 AraC family transcriptional regulator [Cnuella takakiae]SHF11494.1 AraC-type DNA-binding protein [Cnuella takakiae]